MMYLIAGILFTILEAMLSGNKDGCRFPKTLCVLSTRSTPETRLFLRAVLAS